MTNEEAIKLLEGIVAPDDLELNIKLQPYYSAMDKAIEALKTQKVGKWIDSTIPESTLMMCSICKYDLGSFRFNYCPNCGAKM